VTDGRVTIGILALQGDFARHHAALARASVPTAEVRKPVELSGVDGLVIPGGESTTLLTLIQAGDFVPALQAFHASGKPIFGTCAGLILLAREVENPRQPSLGFLDVRVARNAYGRQRESFETAGEAALEGAPASLPMIFIRAPRILDAGAGVRVLARHKGEPVLVREGSVLAATFHPELTDDITVHRYFCTMAGTSGDRRSGASPGCRGGAGVWPANRDSRSDQRLRPEAFT
jgi:5'-phosphate synthase pdxT subunit